MLGAVTERTRLVFLANPANPTGTFLGGQEVVRLADNLPGSCLLVLDGAYAEYVEDFDGGLGLAGTRENVFVTRTFSKMYGLGGDAGRLGLRAAGGDRRAQPAPRAIQPLERGAGGGRGRDARPRFSSREASPITGPGGRS